jgi:hypothetical protein
MITYNPNAPRVRVGHWHYEAAKYEGGTIIKPRIKELRFDDPDHDYEGRLHGFGMEGDSGEMCICALVEKPDGTFGTPSSNTIQLIK